MLVDPDVLRAFAVQVDAAATAIAGIDAGVIANAAAEALPGSETQWSARPVGAHVSIIAGDIAGDISAMGSAVRGAGYRYEVTDAGMARDFTGLF